MINEFGINVSSTYEPKDRPSFNEWAKKYKFGKFYDKSKHTLVNTRTINKQYNFSKLKIKSHD